MTSFSFSSITLFLCLLFSTYLTARCFTPPNPNPRDHRLWKHDRVGALADSRRLLLRRVISLGLSLYHAVLALTFDSAQQRNDLFCRNPANLNPALFTWSAYTATCLFLLICIGAPVRLAAYDGLGKNFTFRLAPPDRLITTGIYRYVQHPSYTGQLIVIGVNLALFFRWDASAACWISEHVLARVSGYGWVVYAVLVVFIVRIGSTRVLDEEAMLKEKFGETWERWHRSTSRFIPGLF
ncbi:hypothetical protein VTN77DRAFT_8780 [Rasamsonia byssochlamydoides]|uniref:uncharacterized protein n=1 Tax=Rasamsonia byssochlamydoides TaxID=89139 RepID=UPI00374402C9